MIRRLILVSVLLVAAGTSSAIEITKPARQAMALADYPHIWWIFVEPEAIADTPAVFTERAWERRERAGVELDSLDYPISDSALSRIASGGVEIRHASRWLRAVSVYATGSQVAGISRLPWVRRIDLVSRLRADLPQDILQKGALPEPQSAQEEHYGFSLLQNRFIRSLPLHRAGLDGSGVLITIIDTGFDTEHPALSGAAERIVGAWDFIDQDADVSDFGCPDSPIGNYQNRHGTLIWGVIGAYVPDTLIGVAWGASFALAKTEISCGGTEIRLEEDNWIAAAEWADSIGADIITSSLGYYRWDDTTDYELDVLNGDSALITRAADMAAVRNILVVTSAGNNRGNFRWPRITLPADGDSVIAVGAVDPDSTIASFSSPGPTEDGRIKPDISSLGVGVFTTRHAPLGGYDMAGGTSLSTPLVAGGAALAMQHNPGITAAELARRIRRSGDQYSNPDNDYGYGLFDAYRTADFVRIDSLGVLTVRSRFQPDTTLITTSGGQDSIPALRLFEPPPAAQLQDQGDGTALLIITPGLEDPMEYSLTLIADVGYVADTLEVTVQTIGVNEDLVFAGPNPFGDSVTVFISPEIGPVTSVSIFNAAGEKVWERVNYSPRSADAKQKWDLVKWNGQNDNGRDVVPGVYLVHVATPSHATMLKLLKSH
jgi:hypothetical protein